MKYSRSIVHATEGVLLLSLVLNVGCSSIICGTTQHVQFTSYPENAQIEIISARGEIINQAQTPTSITLKRGRGYFLGADLTVRALADGYEPKELPIPSRLNGWYFGNILFGGLIGMLIVDPLTGAMYRFPDHVHIRFEKSDSTSATHSLPATNGVLIGSLDRTHPVRRLLPGGAWLET